MENDKIESLNTLDNINGVNKPIRKGNLKIFFGYAAGVGKTYAMLKAAQSAQRRGIDVIVGYVEPHQRPQTIARLQGLEQLDVMIVDYKGIKLNEFDIDCALKRKPKLILVDELAHTNAFGCRHSKRYQDVAELLRNGIDVYTTVNVQHIESLNDMVEAITGVVVKERIPDYIFDDASHIELVDIEPEDLISRLHEGKIYQKNKINNALSNFFDFKNLTALREIAMRRCADRVNSMSDKTFVENNKEYFTDEHILIGLSSSPQNGKIIRTAARMAKAFNGRFTALFVETSSYSIMDEQDKKMLRKNIDLAKQLGASIEMVQGDDISLQIALFARISGVSKVVLGRNNFKRKYYWSKPTLNERLIENAPNLDIYIIPNKSKTVYKEKKVNKYENKLNLADIIKSVGLLSIATAIGYVFYYFKFSEANIIMVYILSVLCISIYNSQRIYSLISSVVSVLLFNYFFTIPRFTLSATGADYPITFLIMFISAFITSSLAVKLKQHAKKSAETAYRTKVLLETNQMLQKAITIENTITTTCNQLSKLLFKDIVFYPVEKDELVHPLVFCDDKEKRDEYLSLNERTVALWVYKNNKHAGATTKTLNAGKCLYLAVRGNDVVYGVIGIAVNKTPLDSFENSIMLSLIGECALAMEKQKANIDRENAAVLAKNEQLRANLLRSISHDLRTPLTSISGNANILLASESKMDATTKTQIYSDIYDDSLWLINLVENLLSVTQLEDGTMNLKCSTELLDEVILEALKHINRKKTDYDIKYNSGQDLMLVKIEPRLIMQVIINIVDNAIKYTPAGSQIIITTKKRFNNVVVQIADNGNGISDDIKPRIFDMFYTPNVKIVDSRRSLGLGLALCKSIIKAHDGKISVFDNTPQGCIFQFTIPLEEIKINE